VLPPGSGQQFTTVLARVQALLAPRLSATLGTYFTWYASHYTGDGGLTWGDATHADVLPRLAFSWRPTADFAWRFATGASIAPPYISLLSSPGTTPVHDPAGAAQGYFINANNGQIAPEKAFGFDLGFDWRLRPVLRLSSDVYFTHVSDMFLTETSQQGTFAPATGASAGVAEPLYVTQTANLGNARYQGVEVALDQAPLQGFGYKIQGSLQRAFTYGLAPSFYSTTAGPYTTNLGVIPNINFQASGSGFNAISPGRIPYSQGYAEVNFRTKASSLFLIGYTYFGPNNSFNEPAFGVLSASVRAPLWRNAWVQLSGDNLTNAYGQPYSALLGGVPVPLINGKLGVVAGSNYGPTTLQFTLHQAIR
jgi:outer membrane receptor protein involved in Fe transport